MGEDRECAAGKKSIAGEKSAAERREGSVCVIKNADWVVAWDEKTRRHVYMKGVDVAFRDDRIIHVGPDFSGDADQIIDGRARMVMPGLVNIHSHLTDGSIDKGVFDEVGAKALYGHALYTHSPLLRTAEEDIPSAAAASLCELLSSGVTTTVDIAGGYPGWVELMGSSGMRVVLGASFRQAQWINVHDHRVDYQWDEEAGWRGLDRALEIADAAAGHPSGRLSAMIVPAQADTCTKELLQASYREAKKRGIPFQTHAAQTMVEFYEILRRHGLSPVRWLDSLGILDDRTTLGHCIFLDHHSWSPLRSKEDMQLLADRGVTVAHCPTVFGRTGMTLESAGDYIGKGVHLGIGTDSYPYNMLEELRHAAVYSRIISGDVFNVSTGDLFYAATVGGARALGREDIGRLCENAKADIVLVDTSHPLMRPLHDPLRNLIYSAAERAVTDVFVDGRLIVTDGRVTTMDYDAALKREEEAQRRALEGVPKADPKNRTIEEIAPLCLERVDH